MTDLDFIMDTPRCAVCKMPVESFYSTTNEGFLLLVAHCHGEDDIVKLPLEELSDILSNDATITIGEAFNEFC